MGFVEFSVLGLVTVINEMRQAMGFNRILEFLLMDDPVRFVLEGLVVTLGWAERLGPVLDFAIDLMWVSLATTPVHDRCHEVILSNAKLVESGLRKGENASDASRE